MRVVVTVPLPDRKTGEPREMQTHLFDFFDLSTDEASERASVRFGLPVKLKPVLINSNRWGRIKAEVVCAMTSKYAIALYEMIQLRANLDRCIENVPAPSFRHHDTGTLPIGANLLRRERVRSTHMPDRPLTFQHRRISDAGREICTPLVGPRRAPPADRETGRRCASATSPRSDAWLG
jgi:hypothetical protein